MTERESILIAALTRITLIAGNLPDRSLTNRTGPNDAAARGLMVCEARRIAKEAIAATPAIEAAQ